MLDYYVHDSAVIDAGAEIGRGTKIWHFCHVMPTSRIGRDCVVGQGVFIGEHVRIGNNVKIQNNVSLYSGVCCEDDVFIGPSAVFTNVINPRSAVKRTEEFQDTIIRAGATIGANATIICGVEIGTYAFVAAGAVVTRSCHPYELIVGNPGKRQGWMSRHGFKLLFDKRGQATCPSTGDRYTLTEDGVVLFGL